MRKSDKKIDNQIRALLTKLCEEYYESIPGFKWLTHVVNYSAFPNSLKVICVFESKELVEQFLVLNNQVKDSRTKINHSTTLSILNIELNSIGVKINKLDKLIRYDDENSCLNEHNGNWADRIKARYGSLN